MSEPEDEPDDEFVETMAQVIYETYGQLIGEAEGYQWDATDGSISEDTKEKFRQIADDALDKIMWTKFLLAKESES